MASATDGTAQLQGLMNILQASGATQGGDGSLFGSMSMTYILINVAAGLLGMGYLMYGKSQGSLKWLGFGLGLCTVPLLISNTIALSVVCLGLAGAPFFLGRGA